MSDRYGQETIVNPSFKRPSVLRYLLPTIRTSKKSRNSDKIRTTVPVVFAVIAQVEVIDGGRQGN